MRKNLIFIFLTFLILSCEKENPIIYNDTIILPQKEIVSGLESLFPTEGISDSTKAPSLSEIEKSRTQIVKTAKKGLEETENLNDFRGDITFRQAAIEYFSYTIDFFDKTPDIDSMLYKLSSKERLNLSDTAIFDKAQNDLKRFLELENKLLEEQQKFLKTFNVNTEF